jgi:hypothetical protein
MPCRLHFFVRLPGQKPSYVYYNAGFENFSRFLAAYKLRFGHNALEKQDFFCIFVLLKSI